MGGNYILTSLAASPIQFWISMYMQVLYFSINDFWISV